MNNDWKNTLYNGLVESYGAPAKVASGMITKPMHDMQLSERMVPTLEVTSNNNYNRGLQTVSRSRTLAHRSAAFMPQE